MGKLTSLLKASLTDGMQLFRIGKRGGKKASRTLPVVLALLIAFAIWGYANILLDSLVDADAGFVMLTLFVLITAFLTLVEGIYKSGSLLFNCRDDDLMLSLPIKKSTVLFVRVFKLYLFELLYNALIIVPAMIAYATRVEVSGTFYLASLLAVILLPVIPVVIACIIGGFVSGVSSRFRMKNLAQIILTMAFLLVVLITIGNFQGILASITQNATSINDVITKLYYPAGAYISMVTDFNVVTLLIFVAVHIAIFAVMVIVLSHIYYRVNSRIKIVKNHNAKIVYATKRKPLMLAIIKKELKKFIDTPVLVVNAAFGLILYVMACVLFGINIDTISGLVKNYGVEVAGGDLAEMARLYAPAITFGLLVMATMMSSITSSMISLEGRSFNILKTLPVKPSTILVGKVLTAVVVMLPFLFVGDIIMFMNFEFNVLQIILILLASFVLPMVAELVGIIINLMYPKMNAETDAEVVKQSTSPMVATFLGMGVTLLAAFLIIQAMNGGWTQDITLAVGVGIFALIFLGLVIYIKKVGTKKFYSIEA